ncbi:hypothetical protein Tco_0725123 [Tanacetum coccineum]|uniref:Uncharacterized protein n=1 Tax=Tanacetum coccineum TaxID=301880 RepID=A0ABQ4YCX4_9ASTR
MVTYPRYTQAAEILKLKARIKKLEKKCKPSISHHKAWLRPDVSTARPDVGTDRQEIGTVDPTTPPTTSIFDDEDITIAQSLIKMKEEKAKEKRNQIERDEELAHKLHKEELAEIARIQEEKATQEEASRVAIMEMFDEVQASIDVDALFAANLQQEEREEYIIEEREKFLAETIAAQRKFIAA